LDFEFACGLGRIAARLFQGIGNAFYRRESLVLTRLEGPVNQRWDLFPLLLDQVLDALKPFCKRARICRSA
jgi:hypothetical protein